MVGIAIGCELVVTSMGGLCGIDCCEKRYSLVLDAEDETDG